LDLAAIFKTQGAAKTSEILDVTVECYTEVIDLMGAQSQTVPESEIRSFGDDTLEAFQGVLDGY
jgi:hypothetical protein